MVARCALIGISLLIQQYYVGSSWLAGSKTASTTWECTLCTLEQSLQILYLGVAHLVLVFTDLSLKTCTLTVWANIGHCWHNLPCFVFKCPVSRRSSCSFTSAGVKPVSHGPNRVVPCNSEGHSSSDQGPAAWEWFPHWLFIFPFQVHSKTLTLCCRCQGCGKCIYTRTEYWWKTMTDEYMVHICGWMAMAQEDTWIGE